MIKGSIILYNDIGVNKILGKIHAHNTRALKYIKQILTDIKGEIDNNVIIVGGFNISLSQWTDHLARKSTGQ